MRVVLAILTIFVTGGCTSLLGLSNVPNADRDGDGTEDTFDNCRDTYNPDQSNIDVDELGDACDACDAGNEAEDLDGDGIPDPCDGCISNGEDVDQDDIPDNCDSCLDPGGDCNPCFGGDKDGDGIPNSCDICFGPNADVDGDGIPEACDACPGSATDADLDGLQDLCDPCPASGVDADGDGLQEGNGPGCDHCLGPNHDEDGDGVLDSCQQCVGSSAGCADNCPHVSNADQANTEEAAIPDAIGNVCDGSPLGEKQVFDGFGAALNPFWYITGSGWTIANDEAHVSTAIDSDRALGIAVSSVLLSTRIVLYDQDTKEAGLFLANYQSPWLATVHYRCTVTAQQQVRLELWNGKASIAFNELPVPPGPVITSMFTLALQVVTNGVGQIDAACMVFANGNLGEVRIDGALVPFPPYAGIGITSGEAGFLWYDAVGFDLGS